jgi:hypothetical protein
VLNEKWQEKGIVFINDAMKTNGNGLMSVVELDLKYHIQQIFPFILRIYWSFSIFFQKYLIKSFTWLNTILNFIKLFHVDYAPLL